MNHISTKSNTISYIYYLVLLIIMVSWTNQTMAPSMPIRFLYLFSVLIFPLFSKAFFLPAALSCLFIVSTNGFSYSYLPSSYNIYSFTLLLFVFLLSKGNNLNISKIPHSVIVLAIFVLIVDLLNNGSISNLFHCLFILALFFLIIDNSSKNVKSEKSIKVFATFFSFASLAMSYYYFRFGYLFTVDYNYTSGLEKTGWTDANYFSTTLGMCVMSSLVILMTSDIKTTIIEKILYMLTIILGVIIMVRCASRGGILALGAGISVLLLFSKLKWANKILILTAIVVFIVFLFNNGYFQLLEYRIQNDVSGGSGRIDIWKKKLILFMEADNVWYYLFGMGFYKGTHLGGVANYYSCFHNDYIAYLVCYGILGIILFFQFLFSPILSVSKHSNYRPAIIASIVYLAICSMTLNPLSEGYLAYFCFYFFIHQLCRGNTNTI